MKKVLAVIGVSILYTIMYLVLNIKFIWLKCFFKEITDVNFNIIFICIDLLILSLSLVFLLRYIRVLLIKERLFYGTLLIFISSLFLFLYNFFILKIYTVLLDFFLFNFFLMGILKLTVVLIIVFLFNKKYKQQVSN